MSINGVRSLAQAIAATVVAHVRELPGARAHRGSERVMLVSEQELEGIVEAAIVKALTPEDGPEYEVVGR